MKNLCTTWYNFGKKIIIVLLKKLYIFPPKKKKSPKKITYIYIFHAQSTFINKINEEYKAKDQ